MDCPKLVTLDLIHQDSVGRLLPSRYFSEIRVLGTVEAGVLSPAEEALLETISLDEHLIRGWIGGLIRNKAATYLLRVQGDSMIDVGILPGDSVLGERREEAKNGDIVICEYDHDLYSCPARREPLGRPKSWR